MPRKRPPPLDDPPAASSTEEEEESSDGEEEQVEVPQRQQSLQQKAQKVEEDEVDDDDDEGEEDEEEDDGGESEPSPGGKPSLREPPNMKKSSSLKNLIPKSSSSQTEDNNGNDDGSVSESDSGSEQSPESPGASDFTIKPAVPKPMNVVVDKPKISSAPKPTNNKPTVAKVSTKRPADSDLANGKPSKSKRSKPSSSGDGEKDDVVVAAGEKKAAINRLWSEDDEIALLEGMLEFQLKKGPDFNNDAFYEFVKDMLRVDVSKTQLTDKVRRLKKKYKTNAGRSENGKDPSFSKPHDHKSYVLSKKIWGGDGNSGVNDANDNKNGDNANSSAKAIAIAAEGNATKSSSRNARKNIKSNSNAAVAIDPPMEEALVVKRDAGKVEVKQCDEGGFRESYPFLSDSLQLHSSSIMQLNELGVNFWEKNLSLVGKSKLEELETKWKQLKMAETELFLKRIELIKEGASLLLNGIKSSEK
ncbi:hypothetical protein Ancab_010947 [Ancistrocladus abbreviatus]